MKKLIFILFIFSGLAASSQTFRNSWINYDQSYYKFRIGTTGNYRITYQTLQSAGLENISSEDFQLWRNGEEQPLYITKTSGPLTASDYIEFYGLKNDGKPDTKLYRDPDFQLSDKNSIISDTSSYYLTVHTSGSNLRFVNTANDVAGNVLPPEKYFMNTVGNYLQTQLNPGFAISVGGVYLYSSSYDQAEGWSSKFIPPNSNENGTIGNLNIYPAGPDATIRFAAAGSAFNSRNIKLTFGNNIKTNVVSNDPVPNLNYIKKTIPFSLALLNGNPNWISYKFENTSSVETDRMVVSFIEFTYPSTFNFNNTSDFYFELPASSQGNYLEITNFNRGSAVPVLYDFTTFKRYEADITSTPGKIKFALPPSMTLHKFRLVSQDPGSIKTIQSLVKKDFINYSLTANQGNYIIISNPVLYNSTSGKNFVEEYRQYRNSSQGGGFNSIVVSIDELSDQFGYGISKHPIAIKEFIQFAAAKFNVKPEFVFIIGKGIAYDEYTKNNKSIYANQLNLVPTFGSPASDILLSAPYGITTPSVPIGRLSAITGDEVEIYLNKIKQYEQEQQSPSQTIADKLWMKNVMQIIGGRDSSENAGFRNYMYGYRYILEDTLIGAHVEFFSKTSNTAVQLISTNRIAEMFKEGTALVAYFGHSSSNTLEYNLNDPSSYDNERKYPVFLVSGCTAGNNFVFDSTRLIAGNKSISENFVISKERGAIAFLASTHYGVPPYLDEYNRKFYNLASGSEYGKPLGVIMQKTIKELDGDKPGIYYLNRADLEEMGLQGDPAVKMFMAPKPDYVIEAPQIKVNPSFISVSEEKFNLSVTAYNTGKAIDDSIYISVKRVYPSGNSEIILRKKIPAIHYADSLSMNIPIIPTRDKGLNKFIVTIDDENTVDELSESNNIATKEFYIFEDEAKPVYPQRFAVIGSSTQHLYASTANPVSASKQYRFELDTTMLFNSPLRISRNITSPGGIIEFDPGITYTDSTVYYWRVSLVPESGDENDFRWLHSSFQYIKGQSGFSQAHYFQNLFSDTTNISLDSNRNWKFSEIQNYIFINSGVYPTAVTLGTETQVNINGTEVAAGFCKVDYELYFTVINPLTLKPWVNTSGTGRFGSVPVCQERRRAVFEFNNITTPARRKQVMDFMDSIPDNYYVTVRYVGDVYPTMVDEWKSDASIYGPGNSLYDKLVAQGFAELDSLNRPRTFMFLYQKNNPAFGPEYILSKGIYDKIEMKRFVLTNDSIGYISSPKFGPSKKWKSLHWMGKDLSDPGSDKAEVLLYGSGYDVNAEPTLLMTIDKSQQDVDLSSINSQQFPYLQLKMRNADSTNFSPYQLKYWILDGDEIPEGAVAPKLFYSAKDTLKQGETLNFGIAFKNISIAAFDSMKIKMVVIDNKNITHTITLPKAKPLISGDTIKVLYSLNTKDYPGLNTLFIEFNPDNDQPESYHSNNFLYHNFYVISDNINPLLDVTFDGMHILNRDIVSSKPHIIIKLKDESEFLKLTDTSLFTVQLRYPDGTLKKFNFDNDTLRFTPASGKDNMATIDFMPAFYGDDDEYELIVTGKDVLGNKSPLDYHVTFRVIGKPMISNFLNYPNPFTTSTAFVFTITGFEVPQNIRIQILTVTGKVVREITKDELGPLHIGRNITEYRWDGTDMYGQKLANGVYLYRVLTNLNGKKMDKFKDSGDNTDKYFNRGYGKMYLMR